MKAHSTLVALVAAAAFLREKGHTHFKILGTRENGVKKQRAVVVLPRKMLILKFGFAVFQNRLVFFSTHTNNWYFAYNVLIKMIR